KGAKVIDLPGMTLLPGLIDAHSHLLLYSYDKTRWDDQVLKEPLAERICSATVHAKADLLSGFTTLRDLGTEGAGYADVGIKSAIEKGIIPRPRATLARKAESASAPAARPAPTRDDEGALGHRHLRAAGVRPGVARPTGGGRGRRGETSHRRPRADP